MNWLKKLPLKKLLLFSGFFVFVIILFSPIILDFIIAPYYFENFLHSNKSELSKNFYRHLPLFNEDIKILEPKLQFLNKERTQNAGVYLNPKIKWDFSESDKALEKKYLDQVKAQEANFKKIQINEKALKILNDSNVSLFEKNPEDFNEVETQWLNEIRQYDYWDIDKKSPMDLFARFSATSPFPKIEMTFPRVHLIKNKDNSDEEYKEAILDVLHYGELSLTTETLVGEMVFVATIGLASEAVKKRPHLSEQLGQWSDLLSEKNRMRRVYWGINQFVRPMMGMNVAIMKEQFIKNSFITGLCGAIREATGNEWVIWSLFMDSSLGQEFTEFKQLILTQAKSCRLTWLKEKTPPWTKLPDEPESFYSSGIVTSMAYFSKQKDEETILNTFTNCLSYLVHYMPNTKKLISDQVLSSTVPNYLRQYEEIK